MRMGHALGHDTPICRSDVLSPRLTAGSCKHPRGPASGRTEHQQTRAFRDPGGPKRPASSSPLESVCFGAVGHDIGSRTGRDPNRSAAVANVPAFVLRDYAGTAPVSRHAPGPARYRRRGHFYARSSA